MVRIQILFAVFMMLNLSCQNERKEDPDKIEDQFKQSQEFKAIKRYIEHKAYFGNQYYWDNEYKIIRHLLYGDTLDTVDLARKVWYKLYQEEYEQFLLDSLNLQPLKEIGAATDECSLLRVIVNTSFIPFASILTIKKTKEKIELNYKDCLFAHYNLLTGKGKDDEYELMINGKLVKGRFFMITDTTKVIPESRYHNLLYSLPPFRKLKDDYEFQGGRILDGEFITIESLEKYTAEIIDYRKYAAQIGEYRTLLDSLVLEALK